MDIRLYRITITAVMMIGLIRTEYASQDTPSAPESHDMATAFMIQILREEWPSLHNENDEAVASAFTGSADGPLLTHNSTACKNGEADSFTGTIEFLRSEEPSKPYVQVLVEKEWTEYYGKRSLLLPKAEYWKKQKHSSAQAVCHDRYTQCDLKKVDDKKMCIVCTSYMPLKLFLAHVRPKPTKPQTQQ